MKISIIRALFFVGALTFAACISQGQDIAPSTTPAQHDMHVRTIKNPPQTAPSLTLTLSAELRNKSISEFRVGSKVWITVKMTNITDHTIDCSGWYGDAGNMSNSFDVRDEDGKPVDKVVHQHPEMDTPSHYSRGIPSGESDIDEVQMERVYKLDRPGKYVIQVSRPDIDFKDDKGNFVIVKSNSITITITG